MDAVLASGRFSPAEICLFQYCRLYLQVHTLSDIMDATGTPPKAGVRTGTLFLSSSTRLLPTLQARPNARAWRTWRSALSLWASENDALTNPLGDWTVLPQAQRFRWTWYSCGMCIFTVHANKFRRFSPIRSRRNYYDYLPHGFVMTPQLPVLACPVLACPCDVLVFDEILRRPRSPTSQAHIPSITILPVVPDFPAYLRHLPHWERYLIAHVTSDLTFEDIVALLREYGGVGVSDGSSARHLGSFGWALATPEGQRLAKCSGIVYGHDPSSFRSEATGLLAVLLSLHHLRTFFDVTSDCSVTLYTDNKGLVVVLPEMKNHFNPPLRPSELIGTYSKPSLPLFAASVRSPSTSTTSRVTKTALATLPLSRLQPNSTSKPTPLRRTLTPL
jgi:hypothetical protein